MTNCFDSILDRLAFLHEWGWRGLLRRTSYVHLRHRFRLYRTERIDAFDEHFGTETSRKLRTSRMDVPPEELRGAVMYWATPASQFHDILRALPVGPQQSTFVDLGCGKGRVLLLALQAGFRKVVGVELSAELAATARRNVAIGRSRIASGAPCDVYCADAESMRLPDEDCVLYLFNPFDDWTLRKVLDNALAVHRGSGRQLVIACLEPTAAHLEALERTPALCLVRRHVPASGLVNAGSFPWHIFATRTASTKEAHHAH